MRRRDPARPGAGDTGLGEGGSALRKPPSQGLPPHTTVQTSARSERRMMHFNWSGSRLPLLVYHSISTPKAAMTCNDSSLTTFTTDRRGVYVRVRARDRCISLHGSVAGHYVEVTVQGDELAFLLAVAQVAATITLAGVVASTRWLRHEGPMRQPGGAIRGLCGLGAIVAPGVALISALAEALALEHAGASMNIYVLLIGVGVLSVIAMTALGAPKSPQHPNEPG